MTGEMKSNFVSVEKEPEKSVDLVGCASNSLIRKIYEHEQLRHDYYTYIGYKDDDGSYLSKHKVEDMACDKGMPISIKSVWCLCLCVEEVKELTIKSPCSNTRSETHPTFGNKTGPKEKTTEEGTNEQPGDGSQQRSG